MEHGPARYNVNTMSCTKRVTNPSITGYGETAAAVAYVTDLFPAPTGPTELPTYLQQVYQFASPAAAAAFFQAGYASDLRCWSGSVTVSHMTFTWTTQSVTKGSFGGHRAIYSHFTTTFSGPSARP